MERSPRGDIWWTLAIAIKAEASRWVLPRASQQQQPGIATPSSGFKLDLPWIPAGTDWTGCVTLNPSLNLSVCSSIKWGEAGPIFMGLL